MHMLLEDDPADEMVEVSELFWPVGSIGWNIRFWKKNLKNIYFMWVSLLFYLKKLQACFYEEK